MKILALTNLYPNPYQPHRAPYNRHQFRMLGELHALRVIAPIAWADEWAARRTHPPLPSGRQLTRDGLTVDHPRYWYTPKILRRFYGRFFLASVRRTFDRAVSEFQPDIVFAPWAYPDGYAAVKLARQAMLPVVVQVHGSDVRSLDAIPSRLAGTAWALQQADGVIAVSRELAGRVNALGVDGDRVHVVIDGVDLQQFHPGDRIAAKSKVSMASGIKHLLFVGNLVHVKGIDVLLSACTQLPRQLGPWQLHLVGEGPLRGRLVRQSNSLGIGDHVRFHGSIPHEVLPDWFRAADLFVLPSRSEGVPNVLLEAAACGLPFVASDVGGIPEIADIGASQLVPPENPQLLSQAIVEMLSRPALPPAPPRDRRQAVAEIARFLESCCERHSHPPLASAHEVAS
jgi:glycosyltransferase involved in cell wall biosynthesis